MHDDFHGVVCFPREQAQQVKNSCGNDQSQTNLSAKAGLLAALEVG